MAVVKTKPTSPGRRFRRQGRQQGPAQGQAAQGAARPQVEVRLGATTPAALPRGHRGGGHKQHYRVIDFKRTKDGVPAVVERLEYDPNRTADIALLKYADGERRYIVAPKGVVEGDPIQSGTSAPIRAGNAMPLRNIPVGSVVHCIELKPGKGAQLGAQRRHFRATGCARRHLRHPAHALRRDAPRAGRVPGHHR